MSNERDDSDGTPTDDQSTADAGAERTPPVADEPQEDPSETRAASRSAAEDLEDEDLTDLSDDDVSDDDVSDHDRADDEYEDDEDEPVEGELVAVGAAAGSARAAARRSVVRSGVTEKKGRATLARDSDREKTPNLAQRLGRFLREVVAELRKVIWPHRKQLVTYTSVVLVFVVFMTALVFGLDALFARVVLAVFGGGS